MKQQKMRRVNMYLHEKDINEAKRLGLGKMSLGIRRMIDFYMSKAPRVKCLDFHNLNFFEKIELAKSTEVNSYELFNDPEIWVRCSVARNISTSIDRLIKLAADESDWVRSDAASNKNLPIDVLRKLSLDEHPSVRFCVISNINIPIDILTNLTNDIDDDVKNHARIVLENICENKQ